MADGLPGTLICDSMAASLMATRKIDAVVAGADRVCLNGDTANKVRCPLPANPERTLRC